MEPTDTADSHSILTYALKNNCSREIYDLIIKTFPELVRKIISRAFLFLKIKEKI